MFVNSSRRMPGKKKRKKKLSSEYEVRAVIASRKEYLGSKYRSNFTDNEALLILSDVL